MTTVITTNLNLEDEAKVIKSLESKIAELKELKDERVALVKEFMNKANVLELQAGAYTFKLTEITRNNVDTKTLKTKYAELYKALLKVSFAPEVRVLSFPVSLLNKKSFNLPNLSLKKSLTLLIIGSNICFNFSESCSKKSSNFTFII